MKIFIEAHTILKNKSGVGWFTHGLVQGLQASAKPDDSIYLITHAGEPQDVSGLVRNGRTFEREIDWLPARLYHTLKFHNAMPPLDLFYGKGLYIFPNFIRWPLINSPSVIVVHDLSMFDVPDYTSPKNLAFMTKHLPGSVRKADLVVAVSHSTKRTLCDKFGVDPSKVVVAHLGLESDIYERDDNEIAHVKAKYGIFGKYLLFVGTLEPRKNIEGIVAAYRALPKKLRNEYSLVLAGGPGWKDEQLKQAIANARLAGERVITTGYIDIEDKPALMSGAELFVWPSHYEGFGIPIVESMKCGTPVVTANNSSLPEAGGDAVAYVDSTDNAQLAATIEDLLENETKRKKMITKGYRQAEKFSWASCAERILEAAHDHKLV